jgi:hypothetical protein
VLAWHRPAASSKASEAAQYPAGLAGLLNIVSQEYTAEGDAHART